MEIKLNVEGMKCEGCEKRIINSLSMMEGVQSVSASHTDGIVTVKTDNDIKDAIASKIEDLGFEVVDE